jgi:hypothetical protein
MGHKRFFGRIHGHGHAAIIIVDEKAVSCFCSWCPLKEAEVGNAQGVTRRQRYNVGKHNIKSNRASKLLFQLESLKMVE